MTLLDRTHLSLTKLPPITIKSRPIHHSEDLKLIEDELVGLD